MSPGGWVHTDSVQVPDERSRRDWFPAEFDKLHQSLKSLHKKVDTLMSDVSAEQATIDAAVAAFTQFVTDVEAEIAALQAANPALDLSALNAIVATAQADDPGPGATPTS